MVIESVKPANRLIICCPLLLPPSIFPSIRVFSKESALHIRWPNSASASVLQWIFRVDFLADWLVWSPWCPRNSQKSSPAPQFESINCLALSLHYGPTHIHIYDYWKNHSFDCMDLVGKVMSLLFNTLSRFVIAFLLRGKHPLILWLQSPFFPMYLPWSNETGGHGLSFLNDES